MRFYRVSLFIDHGSSNGFGWATSKVRAAELVAAYRKDHPDNESGGAPLVEEVEIEPTKSGILSALNQYASHERNG